MTTATPFERVDTLSTRLQSRGSKRDRKQRAKQRRAERQKAAGLCMRCNRPRAPGVGLCEHHRTKAKEYTDDTRARAAKQAAETALMASIQSRNELFSVGSAAVFYVRTSRRDQHPENQLPDLYRAAAEHGLTVVEIFEEQQSAVKERLEFDRLREHARRCAFNVILVWALDRLGRTMMDVISIVKQLDAWGIKLISVREPWLDTCGPARDLLLACFGWVSEQERTRLIERSRAGVARARAEGIPLGRPRKIERPDVERLREEGLSIRGIAQALGASPATIWRILQALKVSGLATGS